MSPPHHREFHQILSPRLLLRGALPKDTEAVLALRQNPLNYLCLNMESGLTADILEARHKQWADEAAKGVRAKMVVMLRDSEGSNSNAEGPLVGVSGINQFIMKPFVDDPTREAFTADIGIIIDSNYGGKGYGYEAIKATIEYSFDKMKAEQVFIETRVRNRSMMNILEKLGVAHAGQVIPMKINDEDGFDTLFSKRMWDEAQRAEGSS